MEMASLKTVYVLLVAAALMPGMATAQDLRGSHVDQLRTRAFADARAAREGDSAPLSRQNLHRLAARMHADRLDTTAVQAAAPPGKHVMGLAIAIGIGAGAGVAGLAASKYGENEGGSFCAACFAQWSAIAIPVGAGVGAAVGYLIDRARD